MFGCIGAISITVLQRQPDLRSEGLIKDRTKEAESIMHVLHANVNLEVSQILMNTYITAM